MTTPGQRLDKWLWFTRLAKTRSVAARLVEGGKVRVNRVRVLKPSRLVHVDDVLTVVVAGHVRVVRALSLGVRRGPAPEARSLYEDLSPPVAARASSATRPGAAPAQREPGAGRPTKRDRRRMDAWVSGPASADGSPDDNRS